MKSVSASAAVIVLAFFMSAVAWAWDSAGHSLITQLAMEVADTALPEWLHSADARRRLAYQAGEADRFRGTSSVYLHHENDPDHYLDLDLLEQFGLSASTLPRLRRRYLEAMVTAKSAFPDGVDPYDQERDAAGTREWPGFLPYAIVEHAAKLRSAFNTERILVSLNDPARSAQIEQARSNVIYHMGMLSHFVGDAAQPLHTTKHHHGWIGENPDRFTRKSSFHAKVDGALLRMHSITFDSLKDRAGAPREVDGADPWADAMALLLRTFDQLRPFYSLERDGRLDGAEGKRFIEDLVLDASAALGGFYIAAWREAAPTEKEIRTFLIYNPQPE